MEKQEVLLRMEHITKRFPGVVALDDVSLTVHRGEIVGLVGENGAGKSTLIEILNPHPAPTGFFRQDSGSLFFDGQEIAPRDPREAQQLGIAIVHQQSNLVPSLTVAENLFLGMEPRRGFLGVIDDRMIEKRCREILDELNLSIDPQDLVGDLGLAQRQLVELAKALLLDSKLVVVDEITAALDAEDTKTIFRVLRDLKARGRGVIFIGHRLAEVMEVSDRIVVLRDGRLVGEAKTSSLTEEQVIRWMVGRELQRIPKQAFVTGEELLRVEGLCGAKFVQDVSFSLHKGEILGIAGLVGSGRSELLNLIFGSIPKTAGNTYVECRPAVIRNPVDALRYGIGFVPEDRQMQGLILPMSVTENLTLAILRRLAGPVGVRESQETEVAKEYIEKLRIVTPSPRQVVAGLSGGNQQKVVLGKWLCFNPKILLVDEPTKGVDIGAKTEIWALLQRIASRGIGIIMVSSELSEVINMSDRILVMCEGRVSGEFDARNVTQEAIMRCATYHRAQAAG